MTDVSPSPQQQQRRETRSSKSKEMIKAIPPSPALSQAELPAAHGLPSGHMNDYYLQQHHQTSTAYYPQEQQVNMESIHPRSQPATRYSTPVPPRSLYQPTNQQLMQPYPQYSYPQPPQYDHSPYTITDEYGTAVSIPCLDPSPEPLQLIGEEYLAELTSYYQSSQPYSTPATSPPSPSRTAEMRVTRSGTYQRGGKAVATTSRPPPASSPPKKKAAKDRPKAVKKSPHLSGPMSEITKNSAIPVVDIGSYVNRSAEERVREVAEGKIPGKIKRPMNAFMLYRKAYQNRAKEWCSQHNHQIVSQVCGDSWPLEPDHVRAQFTEWAQLERDNHQKAHPSYKFTPSKPHNKPKPSPAGRKRPLEDDVPDDDPNDPDWRGAKRPRRMDTPVDHDDEYHQSRSLYGGGYQPNRSAFHATNPGKPLPQPYDAHLGAGGHYYQTMQVRDGAVEHIMYKKTPSPAMMHHHSQHHGGYEFSGYGPPPQMHQHQYQSQQQHHHHPQYLDTQQHQQQQHNQTPQYHSQRVDPSLLPAGAGELLELESSYGGGHYPHQLDPAHHAGGTWNEGGQGQQQQQVYLDQSTTFEIGQYGVGLGLPGDEFGGLVQPEQEKIFNQEPWQVLDSGSLAVDGDDWDRFGELPLEGVGELERK
ncbi:hypothetical protein CONLIGDRAFT_33432 [Coniochaeta ligniaria NRRL 30616]|uniref:HMG box domain-containing protein n=1 Tax=Coniochaeta ligniaria NRRL 30616 TaxID=1408157 RepID=A0A1J7J5B8_9PEZI|nr:hypothetical protein CONLIGDRAFT_33432 [Coniochaeta ligniaria NRRL 30616]